MDLIINWEAVRIASMTVVRREWTVKALEKLARRGDSTPVSGKALSRAAETLDLVKASKVE